MHFTQEDFKKIEQWLLANSKKDTQFVNAVEPFTGNETIAIVQKGKNVRTSVKDVLKQTTLLEVPDFINVTDKFGERFITLEQAIALIPFRSRKLGQLITFLDLSGSWQIYRFLGESLNQWNIKTLWSNEFEGNLINFDDLTPEQVVILQAPAISAAEQARAAANRVDDAIAHIRDGSTPEIGGNDTWVIEGRDTGKPTRGETGENNYQIAVRNGFIGTEEEWLESLKLAQQFTNDFFDII